jgi:hypothetical protein
MYISNTCMCVVNIIRDSVGNINIIILVENFNLA